MQLAQSPFFRWEKNGPTRLNHRLDDFEKEQDEHDGENEAEPTSTVVSETWTHAVTTEAEQQNQNKQKDKHLTFSVPARVRRSCCVMHIPCGMSPFRNIYFLRFAAPEFGIKARFFASYGLRKRSAERIPGSASITEDDAIMSPLRGGNSVAGRQFPSW